MKQVCKFYRNTFWLTLSKIIVKSVSNKANELINHKIFHPIDIKIWTTIVDATHNENN